ncbi:hypothetical protein ACSBR2_028176 [Camellia fascicularis]
MSGEEEDLMSMFFNWLSLLDSSTDGLLGDLISDANINPSSPIVPFTSLHQHQPPSSPKCNLWDTTTTISLSTSTCLSLLAKLITERSNLESESMELQKLGDEGQLVCLKLSIMKEEAETLKPIPAFMIEETMTSSLRFLIELTAQYALSQILATDENLHQSALTTSLQPLVLDPHNNELHQCKIASLMGTLALPVFKASRQSCVGVLELIMTSQNISYAPKMADDAPHDRGSLRLEGEPDIRPLRPRIRPFDLATYHREVHVLPSSVVRHFTGFARRTPIDLLLREPESHLSHDALEVRLSHSVCRLLFLNGLPEAACHKADRLRALPRWEHKPWVCLYRMVCISCKSEYRPEGISLQAEFSRERSHSVMLIFVLVKSG